MDSPFEGESEFYLAYLTIVAFPPEIRRDRVD
jgi:hypothetical protein